MLDQKLVKQKIVDFEYYHNGFEGLSNVDVEVINLKIGKKKATADVILTDGKRIERFNNSEYPLIELGL